MSPAYFYKILKKVKLVTYHDASAFMTTRYHMPETMIDKASKFDVSRMKIFKKKQIIKFLLKKRMIITRMNTQKRKKLE